jgi:2-amino-4-hydroxy-6-hydroxymethyldihydropteridine diphosphokinase
MARCLIGCGSNLGKRREQLDRGLELLRFMPGVDLVAVSRFIETRPIGGPAAQGCYLNAACVVDTDLAPHDLLGALVAVENTLQRRREHRWGERTIDLDLLLYDDLVVDSPDLTIPHPRMATRRFVLEPAVEIAAELPYPPGCCTVGELLDNISVPNPLVTVVGVPGSGATEVATAVADATLARLVRSPRPLPAPAPSVSPAASADEPPFSLWRQDSDRGPADRWLAAVEAWHEPLRAEAWGGEPQVTIADYWLESVPDAAALELEAAEWSRFRRGFERFAAAAVPPQVAILLRVGTAEFRTRLAFRSRSAGRSSDLFGELPAATAVARADVDEALDRQAESLAAWQERLERRLRCPTERGPRAPRAVVIIEADDLAEACSQATAVVEAMV